MQGKGAGAVNRVELECQVLCAALRQSWVRHDKVGAFTSIRELSHLFPDLLPPPEERNGSNKANYYEVLAVRPGSGLNGLVVGYLRTVRKFLKDHNPKDYRQYYNAMLNAGFVLRKPRLRLSHDLVVARRWLYESQLEEEEAAAQAVLLAETPVAGAEAQAQELPQAAGAVAQPHELPQTVVAIASVESADTAASSAANMSSPAQAMAESNLESVRSSQAADTAPSYQPPAVDSQPEDEYDPLEIIQKSWEQAKLSSGSGQSRTSFEMPEQHAFTPPTNTPPPPAVPEAHPSASDQRPPVRAGEITQANPIIDPNQLAQANAASQPGIQMPIPGEPSSAVEPTPPPAPDLLGSSDHAKFASEQARFASEQVAAMQAQADANIAQAAARAQAAAEAQAAANAQAQRAAQAQQSNAGSNSVQQGSLQSGPVQHGAMQSGPAQSESAQSGSTQAGSMQSGAGQAGAMQSGSIHPRSAQSAAANVQHGSAPSPSPSHSAAHSEHSHSSEPNAPLQSAGGFHFDEKQLRKPEAEIELPGVIRLMEASHLITKVEVQALKAQMQLAPNVAVEQLMLNAGYATRNELMSLRLAQDLLSKGTINMAQFQVAMYDERTSGLRMAESLQVRGWLETEVKNPVEEFKKTE